MHQGEETKGGGRELTWNNVDANSAHVLVYLGDFHLRYQKQKTSKMKLRESHAKDKDNDNKSKHSKVYI